MPPSIQPYEFLLKTFVTLGAHNIYTEDPKFQFRVAAMKRLCLVTIMYLSGIQLHLQKEVQELLDLAAKDVA